MINVTKTFLPPLDEYIHLVKNIWDTSCLTNRGPLIKKLESDLAHYLRTDKILITSNGTVPIQILLKLFGRGGEVITTPFSYVATTASIVWENCTPVFVDIDPEHLTIDETKIEAAITERTTCILATHVFGNPCKVEVIEQLANKYGLFVIYDAAHCFGVKYNGQSVFNYGNASTCSFHATKLFHTGEGGAVFCQSGELYDKIFYTHNFGHKSQLDFHGLGINAKLSELNVAMGLAVLNHIEHIIQDRKRVVAFYDEYLRSPKIQRMKIREGTVWNYSYYPIILESEETLLEIQKTLNKNNIFPRRYFYPSLNTIQYTNGRSMPESEFVAQRILCLPLYVGLEESSLELIADLINKVLLKNDRIGHVV
ncbi:MAG TPA: DegT/DnrJ/EryC1/StrS family aminotransferase [Flavobacteriales bacterium]|nr:DegT/DnrJ/EryC1/StrS family aminotransferase [Flavobacteriales bacterium]